MLSDFVQRLLFVRDFDLGNGNNDVVGTKQFLLPLSFLVEMQEIDHETVFRLMKKHVHDYIVDLARVFESEMFSKSTDIFALFGIGHLKIIDFDKDKKRALVEVQDTPLTKLYTSNEPVCSITTGVLSGMFSYLLHSDVNAYVNKCMAKGGRYCEFIIK